MNDKQCYGGLGGIVIEGEPGIGKSELIEAVLVANGYEEERDLENATQRSLPFYRVPVGMHHDEKVALLLKAFNEGAIVLIDEINTSPMMESLLNALLMGTDLAGNRPKKPGFTLIATQNPISQPGRRAASDALQHRYTSFTLPPYTSNEMVAIVRHHWIVENEASAIVSAYKKQRDYAKQHHLTPEPCFRDLIRVVTRKVEARNMLSSEVKRKEGDKYQHDKNSNEHRKRSRSLDKESKKLTRDERNYGPFFSYQPSLSADGDGDRNISLQV